MIPLVASVGPLCVPTLDDSSVKLVGMLTVPTLYDSSVTSFAPLIVPALDDSSVASVGLLTVPTLDDYAVSMLTVPIPNDSYFASFTKTLVISLAVIPSSDIFRMTLVDMINSTLAHFSHFIDVTTTSVPTGLTFNSVCSNGMIINSPCFIIPPDLFSLPSVVKPPAVFFTKLFMLST